MALYFPSLPIYVSVLAISNTLFIISLFNKKTAKIKKIVNLVNSLILDNINIYEKVTLYTNSSLLVLLELSMGIFTSWVLINLIINAHNKLKKYDKKEISTIPEIIFEW